MPHIRPATFLATCLTLFLSPLLWADETPTAEEPPAADPLQRPPLEERSSEAAMLLERRLPQEEQQTLDAGDKRFLALWKPANTGEATGVVILIPATGEHADWPMAISPLRGKLPDAGWSSLGLTLPDQPSAFEAVLAPADKGTDPGDPPAPDASTEPSPTIPDAPQAPAIDPATRILARIEAGIAFAEQQQANSIVLLGHGDGAYWAARFLAERKPAQVKHLLVIAAQIPSGFKPPLEELIPGLKLSTGDLYYKEQNADRSTASRRLQTSKRLQHPAYIQIGLTALPGNQDAEQEQLYRRVRGWLDKVLPAAR